MNAHPGGSEHTARMLALSGLVPPAKILDMGAGAGETVRFLSANGFAAKGIDLSPRAENVSVGDMLSTCFSPESFDGIISQCAFYLSGDVDGALQESFRLLKKGGVLMLSDVCFSPFEIAAEQAGFSVVHAEDMTALWREYYIEAIWRGEAECIGVKGKCRYELLICKKE